MRHLKQLIIVMQCTKSVLDFHQHLDVRLIVIRFTSSSSLLSMGLCGKRCCKFNGIIWALAFSIRGGIFVLSQGVFVKFPFQFYRWVFSQVVRLD